MKTADAKNAGFMIKLVDATSGTQTDSVYMNIDLQTQKLSNTVDTSPRVTPTGSGSYFLMVEAYGGCNWELGISK